MHHGQKKVEYVVKQLLNNDDDEIEETSKQNASKDAKTEISGFKLDKNKLVDEFENEDNVQSQIKWMRRPYLPSDEAFKSKGFSKSDIELAKK